MKENIYGENQKLRNHYTMVALGGVYDSSMLAKYLLSLLVIFSCIKAV